MNQSGDSIPGAGAPGRQGGLAGDVRQVRVHSAATAAELREFLAKTRGRSANEVLGMVAGSRLTRSIALAALGTFVVLLAGSLLPWLLGWGTSPQTVNRQPTAASVPDDRHRPPDSKPTEKKATSNAKRTNAEKAVKAMGLDETKTADPDANPLENRLDHLLDKVK